MNAVRCLAGVLMFTGAAAAEPPTPIAWSWGPVLPTAQSAVGTVAAGPDVVVVGGTYWVGPRDGVPTKTWSRKVKRLNTRSMKWENLPDYPLPLGYPLVVADGRRLWVIGGTNGKRTYAETYRLNLARADAGWVAGPKLPIPRSGARGGVIDGVIYAAGGTEVRGEKSRPAMSVLALDLRKIDQGWREVATIPGPPLEWRNGTVCAGRLYLFGGLVTPDPMPKIPDQIVRAWYNVASLIPKAESWAFDPATRKWAKLRPLPIPMGSGGCAAVRQDRIMITGGLALAVPKEKTPDGKLRTCFSNHCLVYDIAQDQYRPSGSLLLGVADQGCAYTGGKLYVVGGEDSCWKTRTDLVQIGIVP